MTRLLTNRNNSNIRSGHHKFEDYMNNLIEIMMPKDYLNPEVKVSKVLVNMLKMTNAEDKK